jgi:hypothetical protein
MPGDRSTCLDDVSAYPDVKGALFARPAGRKKGSCGAAAPNCVTTLPPYSKNPMAGKLKDTGDLTFRGWVGIQVLME